MSDSEHKHDHDLAHASGEQPEHSHQMSHDMPGEHSGRTMSGHSEAELRRPRDGRAI